MSGNFLSQHKIEDLLRLRRFIDTAYDMKKDFIGTKGVNQCYVYKGRYKKELGRITDYILKYNDDKHKPIIDYEIYELDKTLLKFSSNCLITTNQYVSSLKILIKHRRFEDLIIPKLYIDEQMRKALILRLIEYRKQTCKDRAIKMADFLKLAKINEIDLPGKYIYCIDFVAVVHYINDSVELILLDDVVRKD